MAFSPPTLLGPSNSAHMRMLYDKNRKKAPLGKNLDAHDRDYAPFFAGQRYKREFDVLRDRTKVVEEKFSKYLEPGQELPRRDWLLKEITFREKMIAEGTKLYDGCTKKIDLVAEVSADQMEKFNAKKQAIADQLIEVFPQLKEYLVKVQHTIEHEMLEVRAENSELRSQNNELRLAAGKHMGAGEMSAKVEKFLNERWEVRTKDDDRASNKLIEKEKELAVLETRYNLDKKSWESRISSMAEDLQASQEKDKASVLDNRTKERALKSAEDGRADALDELVKAQEDVASLRKRLEDAEGKFDAEKIRADDQQKMREIADAAVTSREAENERIMAIVSETTKVRVALLDLTEHDELLVLREERMRYEDRKAKFETAEQGLEQEKASLSRQLAERDGKIESLGQQLESTKTSNAENQTKAEHLAMEVERLQVLYDGELDDSIAILNANIDQLARIEQLETALRESLENVASAKENLFRYVEYYVQEQALTAELKCQNDRLSKNLDEELNKFDEERQKMQMQSDEKVEGLLGDNKKLVDGLKACRDEVELEKSRVRMALELARSMEMGRNNVRGELETTKGSLEDLRREKSKVERELGDANTSVVDLRAERDNLQVEVGRINGENGMIQEEVERVKEEKIDLANQLETVRSDLDTLREVKDEADRENTSLKNEFSRLEDEKKRIEKSLEDLTKDSASVDEELGKVTKERNALLDELDDVRFDLDRTRREKKIVEESVEKCDKTINLLETQMKEVEESMDSLRKLKSEIDKSFNTIKAEKLEVEESLETVQTQLDTTRTEKETVDREISTASEKISRLESERQELTNSLDAIQQEKIEVESQLETTKSELDRTNSELETIKSELDTIRSEKSAVDLRIKDANDEAVRLNGEKQELLTSLSTIEKDKKDFESRLETIRGEKTLVDLEVKTVRDDLVRLEKDKVDLNNTLDAVRLQKDDAVKEIETVKIEKDDVESRNKSLTSEIETTRSKLETTKSKLGLTNSELEIAKTKLESTDSKLNSTKKELAETKSRVVSIESELKNTRSEFNTAKSRLNKVTSDLKAVESRLEVLRRRKEDGDKDIENACARIDRLQSEKENLRRHLSTSESETNAAIARAHDLQQQKAAIQRLNEGFGVWAEWADKNMTEYDENEVENIRLIDDYIHAIERLNLEMSSITEKHASCAGEISGLNEKIKNMVGSEVHEKLKSDSKNAIAKLQKGMKQMITKVDSEREIGMIREKLQSLKVEHDLCQPKIQGLETAIGELNLLKESSNAIVDAHSRCAGQISGLEEMVKNMVSLSLFNELKADAELVLTEHARCRSRITELENTTVPKDVHEQLKTDFVGLSSQHVECQPRIDLLKAEIERRVPKESYELLRSTTVDKRTHDQLQAEHSLCRGRLTENVTRTPHLSTLNSSYDPSIPDTMDRRQSADSGYGFDMSRQPSNESQSFSTPQQMRRPSADTAYGYNPHSYIASQLSGRHASPGSISHLLNTPQQSGSRQLPGSGPSRSLNSPQQLGQFGQPSAGYGQPGSLSFPRKLGRHPSPGFGPTLQSGSPSGYPPQSPSMAYSFGSQPPTGSPQPQQYAFLINGYIASGPRTMAVAYEVITMMDGQIAAWNAHPSKVLWWSAPRSVGGSRCVEVRRSHSSMAKAPPASDPNGDVACPKCIEKKRLCVLIGETGGPVVVPLPLVDRTLGASSSDVGYYVKQ